MTGAVVAVSLSPTHTFSKPKQSSVRLLVGRGVEGDAHCSETVQHLSRIAKDPTQANLRQVHLIHSELHDELNAAGFHVYPGAMGENITTRGVDLLGLPTGAQLRLGDEAVIEITGLRNPCHQLDDFEQGLLQAVLARDAQGALIRKSGVMAVVLVGGEVHPNDSITVELPPEPHQPLQPV
jgi:MOSC domain-containing protein YiiM